MLGISLALGSQRRRAGGGGFVGAYDAIPNIAAAYSMRRLLTSYTGALVRLRRSSDNAEQDIGYLSNGDPDTAAAATFIGGGSGYIVTWYDQSGNGYNATQSTAASQPLYVAAGQNGRPVGRWDGTNDAMVLPGGGLQTALPLGVVAVIKSSDNVNDQVVFAQGKTTDRHRGWWCQYGSIVSMNYGDDTSTSPTARRSKAGSAPGTGWRVATSIIRGATDMSLRLDGVDIGGSYSGSGGALNYGAGTDGRISSPAPNPFNGDLAEFLIFSADPDEEAAESAANAYWSVY